MSDSTATPSARPDPLERRALIVLVDGDADWRASAAGALRGHGYDVVACGSLKEVPREALRQDISRAADLLVVDAALADVATRRAAVGEDQPASFGDCPVLILAGARDEDAIERALEADAADFFIRSTHWQLLVERVRRLCHMADMKRELLASHDRLARAHTSARVGTFDFDLGSRTFHGSTGSFSILGFDSPRTAISADEFLRLVPRDRHEALFSATDHAIRADVPFALELPLRKVGGDWMTVRVEAEPRRNSNGRIAMLRGVIRDADRACAPSGTWAPDQRGPAHRASQPQPVPRAVHGGGRRGATSRPAGGGRGDRPGPIHADQRIARAGGRGRGDLRHCRAACGRARATRRVGPVPR
ncbi:MAG: hypothetical protein R3E41_00140 [Burkholderiaceae bacterium]